MSCASGINTFRPGDDYIYIYIYIYICIYIFNWTGVSLVEIKGRRLLDTKPLPECLYIANWTLITRVIFLYKMCISKYRLQNVGPFVRSSTYMYKYVYPSQKIMHQRLSSTLRPANERRRYFVTTSLIGWVQCNASTWWLPSNNLKHWEQIVNTIKN